MKLHRSQTDCNYRLNVQSRSKGDNASDSDFTPLIGPTAVSHDRCKAI